MDDTDYSELKRRVRTTAMQWIAEQIAKGESTELATLTMATCLTAEAITAAGAIEIVEEYLEMVAPLFAKASPKHVTVLHYPDQVN